MDNLQMPDFQSPEYFFGIERTLYSLAAYKRVIYVSGVLPNGDMFDNVPFVIHCNDDLTNNGRLARDYNKRINDYEDAAMPFFKTVREALENKTLNNFSKNLQDKRDIRAMGEPEMPLNAQVFQYGVSSFILYGTVEGHKTFLEIQPNLTEESLVNNRRINPVITKIHLVYSDNTTAPVYESPVHKERLKLKAPMRALLLEYIIAYCRTFLEPYLKPSIDVDPDVARRWAIHLAIRVYQAASSSVKLDGNALKPIEVTAKSPKEVNKMETETDLYVGPSTGTYTYGVWFLENQPFRLAETSQIKDNAGEVIDYRPAIECAELSKTFDDAYSLTPGQIFDEGVRMAQELLEASKSYETEEDQVQR